ncbi:MAG TPA: formate hydrogenlyase [Bacteroidetes bacterium]|nr:formate hydrogenlyase [Bacteroidota bacterium]
MEERLVTLAIWVMQLAVVLALPPFVNGMVRKTKARLQNRKGPPLSQSYSDLLKLFRKEALVSANASWIFAVTPYVVFGTTLLVALLMPMFSPHPPLAWMSDFILLVYLLGLGRFFLALSALDTSSSFGGLGASREMTIASLVEPAMILSIFATAASAGTMNLNVIASSVSPTITSVLNPSQILAFAGLFIVTLAETGRIPVDNPATHLELTMIHEAMILEYSGRHLALIEWASQIKLLIFFSLLVNLFIPMGVAHDMTLVDLLTGMALFLLKVAGIAVVVAIVESTNAKLRLFRVPDLLMVAFTLSLLSLVLRFLIR